MRADISPRATMFSRNTYCSCFAAFPSPQAIGPYSITTNKRALSYPFLLPQLFCYTSFMRESMKHPPCKWECSDQTGSYSMVLACHQALPTRTSRANVRTRPNSSSFRQTFASLETICTSHLKLAFAKLYRPFPMLPSSEASEIHKRSNST